MSIRAIGWALETKVGNLAAKLVLISLCDNADNDNLQCYPKAEGIAERCEISRRAVFYAIMYLKEKGFIKCEHRRWPGGVKRSPLYTILMPSAPVAPLSANQDTRSASACTRGTVTESSLRKNGSIVLKEEGFNALPHSPEFVAWKSFFTDKKKHSWVRELNIRELEGRPFNFEAQWPPQ
jgi:hypothetical protein